MNFGNDGGSIADHITDDYNPTVEHTIKSSRSDRFVHELVSRLFTAAVFGGLVGLVAYFGWWAIAFFAGLALLAWQASR